MNNRRSHEKNATLQFLSRDSTRTDASRIRFKCEKREVNGFIHCLDLRRDRRFAKCRWRVCYVFLHTGWSPGGPSADGRRTCPYVDGGRHEKHFRKGSWRLVILKGDDLTQKSGT